MDTCADITSSDNINGGKGMEKKEYCKTAVKLAILGAFASFFLPSVGFSLSVCCLVVNHMERKYYDTGKGLLAGTLGIVWALLNWLVGASVAGLL